MATSTGGGEDPKKTSEPAPAPPAGYKQPSLQNRQDWNRFLDYLEANKVGGSADLDKRDQSLGMTWLNKYRALNPKTSITPDLIPSIQYDQYMLRKGDTYPSLTPEQLQYVRKGLNPAYMSRPVSAVDGWLGSITSKLYYPLARRGASTGEQWDFGPDIETYAKSVGNNEMAKKYLVKQ